MTTRANVRYDLTGSLAEYKKDNVRAVIFSDNQRVEFNEPVFLNSIVVMRDSGTSQVALRNGAADGWIVESADIDYAAMSDAKLQNNNFNSQLVKSIVVKYFTATMTTATITVSYQRLRKDLNEEYTYDGNGPEYSPALMAKVLEDIEYLSRRSNTVTDLFGASLEDHTLIEEDLTGVATTNFITGERHTINVPQGRLFISPDRGSFFDYDVHVYGYTGKAVTITQTNKTTFYGKTFVYTETQRLENLNTTSSKEKRVVIDRNNADGYIGMTGTIIDDVVEWVKGTDFIVVGANLAKTKKALHESGVYEHIQVLKSYVGDVMISYHAFGGHVATQDIIDMHKNMQNLTSVFKGSGLLTDSSLYTHPIVREMIKRINAFEEYHNHYAQIEHIISVRDQGFHWYNIGFIYDNRWEGVEDAICDLGHFRIESLARDWSYEFDVITNIDADRAREFIVKTRACGDTHNVNDFKNYMVLEEKDNVYLRLCYVADGKTSGVVLQYGMKFDKFTIPVNGVATETLIVTNKSGNASRWRLYSNPLDMDYPADDNFSTPIYHQNADDDSFTMPNGYDTWSSSSANCKSNIKPLEHEGGMIYWAGCYPMHKMMSTHTNSNPFQTQSRTILQPMVRDTQLKPYQVSGVSFDIFDRVAGAYMTIESPCTPNHARSVNGSMELEVGSNNTNKEYSGQEVIFCLQDLCALRYALNSDASGNMQLSVITTLGTNSIINERFDLRQVRLHFN